MSEPPGGQPTIAELTAVVRAFADARDWRRFHNPKNLALALAGEVGELAAELQWLTPQDAAALADDPAGAARVAEELADVAIYLVRLADELGIDLGEAIVAKLRTNADRYPADRARGHPGHPPPPLHE